MELIKCPNHRGFPLETTNTSLECVGCFDDNTEKKQGYNYKCGFCNFYVHAECFNINIPSRHKHPLQLLDLPPSCCLCETNDFELIYYHCSRCYFSVCVSCARGPLTIHEDKAHEHELHQTPIKLSFTCDACGYFSSGYPFMCHQCCFIIHRECIYLPRVIQINRHDHRISRVSSLGPGNNWMCSVCDEHVNGDCGAYSCLLCSYVVHSKCATHGYVWDGLELEGIPEEEEEEIKPFQVIDENLITYFYHCHNPLMKVLGEDDGDKHCCVCTLPIYSELCYKCMKCDFILHDACANLPRKKRYLLTMSELTLPPDIEVRDQFICSACLRFCNGFSYIDDRGEGIIDVRCASVSVPFKHGSHRHSLLFHIEGSLIRCEGCCFDKVRYYLRCNGKDDCGGFSLCFRCATLPTLVRHAYDDHPLSLYYGERDVNSTYSCGICEEQINSKSWFYKCNDCGSILHTNCAFPNLIYSRPGNNATVGYVGQTKFVRNKRLSRPICSLCKTRCMGDIVLNDAENSICYSCIYMVYYDILSRA